METILSVLCWWGLIGYFVGALSRRNVPKNKKQAMSQAFCLGPFFWIGLSIWGICVIAKRKLLTR